MFSYSLARRWQVLQQQLYSCPEPLNRAWTLNPTAHQQLVLLGGKVGILFHLLAAALVTSGVGWFRRRLWGWRLAVVIIGTQVLGDLINLMRGDWLRGGTGAVIAGALLLYLLSARTRDVFSRMIV